MSDKEDELGRLRALNFRLLCENLRHTTHFTVIEQALAKTRGELVELQGALERLKVMNDVARSEKQFEDSPFPKSTDELETYDAFQWATAFMREFEAAGKPVDEFLMSHWFTACLMRGFDEAVRRMLLGQITVEGKAPDIDAWMNPAPETEHDLRGTEQCTVSHIVEGKSVGQCARCRKCHEWIRPTDTPTLCRGRYSGEEQSGEESGSEERTRAHA